MCLLLELNGVISYLPEGINNNLSKFSSPAWSLLLAQFSCLSALLSLFTKSSVPQMPGDLRGALDHA